MELGAEDVSLLERCPHFRGCSVQASMRSVLLFAQVKGHIITAEVARVCANIIDALDYMEKQWDLEQ